MWPQFHQPRCIRCSVVLQTIRNRDSREVSQVLGCAIPPALSEICNRRDNLTDHVGLDTRRIPPKFPSFMSIADIRRDYSLSGLRRSDLNPDPIAQFRSWFDQALGAR